jgi:hypothetical protein
VTSSRLEPVRRNLARFVAGGEYWPLWQAVMDATSAKDLSPREETWFDALYDLVHMGHGTRSASPRSVTVSSRKRAACIDSREEP